MILYIYTHTHTMHMLNVRILTEFRKRYNTQTWVSWLNLVFWLMTFSSLYQRCNFVELSPLTSLYKLKTATQTGFENGRWKRSVGPRTIAITELSIIGITNHSIYGPKLSEIKLGLKMKIGKREGRGGGRQKGREAQGRKEGWRKNKLNNRINFQIVLLPKAAMYNSWTLQNNVVIYKVHTPEPCNWITKRL